MGRIRCRALAFETMEEKARRQKRKNTPRKEVHS